MADFYNEPQHELSFPVESYERSAEGVNMSTTTNPSYQYGAVKPPVSFSRTCLPNKDGEYRPYKIFSEAEVYIESSVNYYYLGATACPKFLKCSKCPIK